MDKDYEEIYEGEDYDYPEEETEEYNELYYDMLDHHEKIICPYCGKPLRPYCYDPDDDNDIVWEQLLHCKEHGNFQFNQLVRKAAGLDWEQSPGEQYPDPTDDQY